jgi:UDP-N-acetylglucosamine acyltransferase
MRNGNIIHHTAMVHDSAKIGTGNIIHAGVIITANVEIGNNNEIFPYSVIGTTAEHRDFHNKASQMVIIGNDNIIREYVTINAGTIRNTVIGSQCYFLRGSHVGHDCSIYDKVTLSCNALVGGESVIFEGANLGLGVAIHQRSIIGHYCMIGMNSTVTKKSKVVPFYKFVGSPLKGIGLNHIKYNSILPSDRIKLIQEYEGEI